MDSLYSLDISKVLFLDIETVSAAPSFDKLDEKMKNLWTKKSDQLKRNEDDTPETLYNRAAIYSEFGKIICISVGFFNGNRFRIKSFYGHDEKEILNDFAALLNRHSNRSDFLLCAHNGKEFDFPYIARRMLVNGIRLPSILQIAGKKPWEVRHLDTMELWKFGDYKSYTSLELLCAIFDIPTPKDDINGSEVGRVYWEEDDLERIKTYCQKDVVSIAQIMRRYLGLELANEDLFEYC